MPPKVAWSVAAHNPSVLGRDEGDLAGMTSEKRAGTRPK